MYNKKIKTWESQPNQEGILQWCREEYNKDNPQALFIQADALLAQASKGKRTADAVYLMERAAKLGNPQAALAMGQMFQYGWAVSRSRKAAQGWYEKAAQLGSSEAKAILEDLHRQKKRRVIAEACLICLAVCLGLGAALLLPRLLPVQGVRVGEGTTLVEPATQEEFVLALADLLEEYDTELVISGQQSTNRLMLKFEGAGIDLSRFPAATVIADADNYVIIQFTSQEEAEKCLAALKAMAGVLYVDMDDYSIGASDAAPADAFSFSGVPYRSGYTGLKYLSWGAEYLGMDRLAAWLQTQQTTPVVVAVLDTGTEPCSETASRILPGTSTAHPRRGEGLQDHDGHGTHVAGTILDCTRGLDVTILPVQVLQDNGEGSDSMIVEGLRYAIRNNVDVINMSLGGRCKLAQGKEDCGSLIDCYVHEAVSKGIVVVVSAGNGDDQGRPENTNINCPSHLDDCIVVAACDWDGDLGYFSNYGQSVDVCAPGVEVTSYYPGDTREALNGTSMAAPHIAALAAMLKLILPDKTPAQIESYIKDYCILTGDPDYYGEGIPWAGYLAGD